MEKSGWKSRSRKLKTIFPSEITGKLIEGSQPKGVERKMGRAN
jgi:hypothetical protein